MWTGLAKTGTPRFPNQGPGLLERRDFVHLRRGQANVHARRRRLRQGADAELIGIDANVNKGDMKW